MDLETSLVELAHEALFHAWPLLSSWLDEEQDFLIGPRVEEAERFWRAATEQQKDKALLSGLLLERAREWNAKNPDRFAGLSHFVQGSIARDDADSPAPRRLKRHPVSSHESPPLPRGAIMFEVARRLDIATPVENARSIT